MTAPFLLAHIVGPLRFTIGGALSPVSIRDQMLRGRMFVQAAWRERLISKDRPLLVVGAGAAGVTAALTAAALRVPTLLIDIADAPFTRQKDCHSRFIDPVQYDWPLTHWREARFPPSGTPALPLSFPADSANVLAARWTSELNQARVLYHPTFRAEFGAQVQGIPVLNGDLVEVTIKFLGQRPVTLPFGAVVSSLGPGVERTWVEEGVNKEPAPNAYRGPDFWENDSLTHLIHHAPGSRILISGGGDGALQDFLRIVTGSESAREFIDRIFHAPMKRPEGRLLISTILAELQAADDQAQRLLHWSSSALNTHAILTELHQAYERQIRRFLADVTILQELRTALSEELSSRNCVTLAFPCTHFGHAYGLNRFLALLLLQLLSSQKRIVARPNTSLVSVECLKNLSSQGMSSRHEYKDRHGGIGRGHQACFQKPHQVTFVEATCQQRSTETTTPEEFYDVVVVRHGVTPRPNIFGSEGNRVRHLLPYFPLGRRFDAATSLWATSTEATSTPWWRALWRSASRRAARLR